MLTQDKKTTKNELQLYIHALAIASKHYKNAIKELRENFAKGKAIAKVGDKVNDIIVEKIDVELRRGVPTAVYCGEGKRVCQNDVTTTVTGNFDN